MSGSKVETPHKQSELSMSEQHVQDTIVRVMITNATLGLHDDLSGRRDHWKRTWSEQAYQMTLMAECGSRACDRGFSLSAKGLSEGNVRPDL